MGIFSPVAMTWDKASPGVGGEWGVRRQTSSKLRLSSHAGQLSPGSLLSQGKGVLRFFLKKILGVQWICSVVCVSGVQPSESIIHRHRAVPFPVWLLRNIRPTSLCCTAGPCLLPTLYAVVGIVCV